MIYGQIGAVAAGGIASRIISQYADQKVAALSGTALSIGVTAVNMILSNKTRSENKNLRAYYAHGR